MKTKWIWWWNRAYKEEIIRTDIHSRKVVYVTKWFTYAEARAHAQGFCQAAEKYTQRSSYTFEITTIHEDTCVR